MGLFVGSITFLMLSAFFLIGTLPFISGFVAAKLAKRNKRNAWRWGVGTFVVVAVTILLNLGAILPLVVLAELDALFLMGKHEETVLVPLKDANKVVMKQSLSDTDFDVPLTYLNSQYYPPARGWQNVTKRQYAGDTRESRPFIEVTALWPGLDPMSESNYKVFEAPNGKGGPQVSATLTTQPSTPTDYFFRNFFSRLERQSDDPVVPGMLHYSESLGVNGKRNIFFSHDHATPQFTEISCTEYTPEPVNPTCDVTTYFDYKGHHFGLGYNFAPTHLPHWREIDHNVKALFAHFGDAAQHSS